MWDRSFLFASLYSRGIFFLPIQCTKNISLVVNISFFINISLLFSLFSLNSSEVEIIIELDDCFWPQCFNLFSAFQVFFTLWCWLRKKLPLTGGIGNSSQLWAQPSGRQCWRRVTWANRKILVIGIRPAFVSVFIVTLDKVLHFSEP